MKYRTKRTIIETGKAIMLIFFLTGLIYGISELTYGERGKVCREATTEVIFYDACRIDDKCILTATETRDELHYHRQKARYCKPD